MSVDFERVMRAALDELPADLHAALSNLELVVEERDPHDPDIYGLYTGIPLTERGSDYASMPDRIAIYREPLLLDFGNDPERLAHEIRITVLHELGHHFGLGEDRLEELGWA